MIGQKNLLNKIDTMISSYPKFSIIVGPKNSGKKTIVKYICNKLNLPIINFGTSIDEVRNVIDMSYEQIKPICYVCSDADLMSIGAKNALLKVTEEPPNNAYFMLTLQSMSNTLETIQSRGTVLNLDNYTSEELIEYRKLRKYKDKCDDVITNVCSNIGEVDELFSYDVSKFYSFAETVAFQVSIPTSGNIFKIPKALKTKDTDKDGYDPVLLFKAVRNLYIKRALESKNNRYLWASVITSECLRDLALNTVNKVGTIDKWIMDVRTVLRG